MKRATRRHRTGLMTLAVAYAMTVGTLWPRPSEAQQDQAATAQAVQTTEDPATEADDAASPQEGAQSHRAHAGRPARGSAARNTASRMTVARIAAVRAVATANGCKRMQQWAHDDQGAGAALVQAAEKLLGCPYHFGGASSAEGFDCSGLVWYVHQLLRMPIPRRAEEQSMYAAEVSEEQLQPGDLVFFHFAEGDPRGSYLDFAPSYINHVGIYVGGGKFIHAPKAGKGVSYAKMADFKPYFLKAGRYWSGSGMLARE